MKINEIIFESADDSFWQQYESLWNQYDEDYNPKAHEYAQKQVKRAKIVQKGHSGTPVITKPVGKKQKPFSTIPREGENRSPGYVGNVDARVRMKHLSKKKGEELVSATPPESTKKPFPFV